MPLRSLNKGGALLLLEETELRFAETSRVIELAQAVGDAKRVALSFRKAVKNTKRLFELYGIKLPWYFYYCDWRRFEMAKNLLLVLAVQHVNIFRFYDGPEKEYVGCLLNSRAEKRLSNEALIWLSGQIDDNIDVFNLDENHFPRERTEQCQCSLKAFEELELRAIFVGSIKEFLKIPIPTVVNIDNGSFKTASSLFKAHFDEQEIMILY